MAAVRPRTHLRSRSAPWATRCSRENTSFAIAARMTGVQPLLDAAVPAPRAASHRCGRRCCAGLRRSYSHR
eukprot:2129862-Prymnesium_polylepis.1